ncbi:MAG: NGG1p interacting factor NIF3 [Pontibacterium sp.]
MFKLCFYVPEASLEAVKAAVFGAGAGRMGNYDQCCWQVLGQGQFRPLTGANPAIGEQGQLESLPEWKVETVVVDEQVDQVIAALKAAHPYEEVAYDLWRLV